MKREVLCGTNMEERIKMNKNLIQKIRSGDKQFKEKINNTPYPYSMEPFCIVFNEVVFKVETYRSVRRGGYSFYIRPYNHELLLSPYCEQDPMALFNKHKKFLKKHTEIIKAYYKLFRNYPKNEIYGIDKDEFTFLVWMYIKRFTEELNTPKIKELFIQPIDKNCKSGVYINTYAYINRRYRQITVSEKMRYLPKKLIKYIIYHEIYHLIEPSHNKKFKDALKNKFSNYDRREYEFAAYHFKIREVL